METTLLLILNIPVIVVHHSDLIQKFKNLNQCQVILYSASIKDSATPFWTPSWCTSHLRHSSNFHNNSEIR